MTRNELDNHIQDYVRSNLSPTEGEQGEISEKYNHLKSFLKGRTFQIGSYARRTSTTPVNDLDVIYRLPDDLTSLAKITEAAIDTRRLVLADIIQTLANEIGSFYGGSARVKPQPHSVGIYFGDEDEFSIDLVPSLPAQGEMIWVPDSAHFSIRKRRALQEARKLPPSPNWIKSDPKGYIDHAVKLDDATSGRFRKSAKVVKKWRAVQKHLNDSFSLKSFHLEQLVTRIADSNHNAPVIEIVGQCFTQLPSKLTNPEIVDRADPSRFIDSYVAELTSVEREIITLSSRKAQTALAKLDGARDKDEVWDLLDDIFSVPEEGQLERLPVAATRGIVLGDTGHCQVPPWPQTLSHSVRLDGYLYSSGGRKLFRGINSGVSLSSDRTIRYRARTNVSKPYEVFWQVVNTGDHARSENGLRGNFFPAKVLTGTTSNDPLINWEPTKFTGRHWIECFIVKSGTLVARSGRFYVNIKNAVW